MVSSGVEGIRGVEAVLKALANRRRLMMLAMLRRRKELHVGALADVMRLPIKTVSRNLRLLERAGLVLSDRRGVFVCYRLISGAPQFVRLAIEATEEAEANLP